VRFKFSPHLELENFAATGRFPLALTIRPRATAVKRRRRANRRMDQQATVPTPCIQAHADLLQLDGAESFSTARKEIAMAKGQMRSNKEKKKPKADKNLKKGGAAPSPFASGKTPAGQSPNSKKN
jgi:hypothetical protein